MWKTLSLKDKAEIIKLGISNGIRDLNVIRDTYNQYACGGYLNKFENGGEINNYHKDLKKIANSANTNFIQRLNDPNREYLRDWENSDEDGYYVATHKMGQYNNAVFPYVQQVGQGLIDFTNPTISPTEADVFNNAYKNAINNGDIIYFPTVKDAEYFSTHYKDIYNNPFNNEPSTELNYAYGGHLRNLENSLALYSNSLP